MDEAFCPAKNLVTERDCLDNPECRYQVPQTSHIEHNVEHDGNKSYQWRKGEWTKALKKMFLFMFLPI